MFTVFLRFKNVIKGHVGFSTLFKGPIIFSLHIFQCDIKALRINHHLRIRSRSTNDQLIDN